jgi:hypothetical protein
LGEMHPAIGQAAGIKQWIRRPGRLRSAGRSWAGLPESRSILLRQ